METTEYFLAGAADVELLVEMRMRFSDELNGIIDPEKDAELRESLLAYFKEKINKEYICWYAKVNNEVAAIAGMGLRNVPGNIRNPSGKWGYIMSVYTLPEYRKKGLCKDLLDRLQKTGREMGVTAFELHATKEGEPVYLKNGFLLHDEPTYRKFLDSDQ